MNIYVFDNYDEGLEKAYRTYDAAAVKLAGEFFNYIMSDEFKQWADTDMDEAMRFVRECAETFERGYIDGIGSIHSLPMDE